MPNLHGRSFALARRDLRERLFGLGTPPPEYFPPRRHWGPIRFAVLLFVLPWPTRVQSSGVLRPAEVFPIHAPEHAMLAALPLRDGAKVKAGDVMLQFAVAENASQRQGIEAQIDSLRWRSEGAGFDVEQRALLSGSPGRPVRAPGGGRHRPGCAPFAAERHVVDPARRLRDGARKAGLLVSRTRCLPRDVRGGRIIGSASRAQLARQGGDRRRLGSAGRAAGAGRGGAMVARGGVLNCWPSE